MWSRTGSFCLEYEGAHRSCSLSVGACFYYSGACAAAGRHLNIKTAGTRSCILSRTNNRRMASRCLTVCSWRFSKPGTQAPVRLNQFLITMFITYCIFLSEKLGISEHRKSMSGRFDLPMFFCGLVNQQPGSLMTSNQ